MGIAPLKDHPKKDHNEQRLNPKKNASFHSIKIPLQSHKEQFNEQVIKNEEISNRMNLLEHAIENSGFIEQPEEKTFGQNKKAPIVKEEDAKITEESIEDGNEYGQLDNRINPDGSMEDVENKLHVEYIPKQKEFGENYDQVQPTPYGQHSSPHSKPNHQKPTSQPTKNKQKSSSQPTSFEQQPSSQPTPFEQQPPSQPTPYEEQPAPYDQHNQRNTESCSCGQSNTFEEQMNRINRQFEEDDYVIGGSEALANSFPWVVRIRGGCAGNIYLAGVSKTIKPPF